MDDLSEITVAEKNIKIGEALTPRRYLTYGAFPNRFGFIHLWYNVEIVCLESLYHKRAPVLPRTLYLPETHNPTGGMWSSWDKYWDMDELNVYIYQYTRCLFREHIKLENKITLPALWLNDIETWLNTREHKMITEKLPQLETWLNTRDYNTVTEKLQQKIETKIAQSTILYRKPWQGWWGAYPPASKREGMFVKKIKKIILLSAKPTRLLAKLVPRRAYARLKPTFIHLKPTSEVWTVVDDIVKRLGSDFWAIHIRRNDVLKHLQSHALYASNLSWVTANLECARLKKNMPLFLMTDEQDPLYLLPLEKKFNIIRANDFKSFQNLIVKYPNDNFLYFHVERLVFLHAKRRYKTVEYFGKKLDFMPFQKPRLDKVKYLPPHCFLPANCEEKYFSSFSLKHKYKILNKWPFLIPLRYSFAQSMLHFRLGLRRRFEQVKI